MLIASWICSFYTKYCSIDAHRSTVNANIYRRYIKWNTSTYTQNIIQILDLFYFIWKLQCYFVWPSINVLCLFISLALAKCVFVSLVVSLKWVFSMQWICCCCCLLEIKWSMQIVSHNFSIIPNLWFAFSLALLLSWGYFNIE